MMKLMNSDTHSCMHSLASFETCNIKRVYNIYIYIYIYIYMYMHDTENSSCVLECVAAALEGLPAHLAVPGDHISHDPRNVGNGKKAILPREGGGGGGGGGGEGGGI